MKYSRIYVIRTRMNRNIVLYILNKSFGPIRSIWTRLKPDLHTLILSADSKSLKFQAKSKQKLDENLHKPDLHTSTLSADSWNAPSNLKQNTASMQWLLRFWKICELVTDFGPIYVWILLEILKISSRLTKSACVNPALNEFK